MGLTRREFVTACAGGLVLGMSGYLLWKEVRNRRWDERVFIARVPGYQADIKAAILDGLQALGVGVAGHPEEKDPPQAQPGGDHPRGGAHQHAPPGGPGGGGGLSVPGRGEGIGGRRAGTRYRHPAGPG